MVPQSSKSKKVFSSPAVKTPRLFRKGLKKARMELSMRLRRLQIQSRRKSVRFCDFTMSLEQKVLLLTHLP